MTIESNCHLYFDEAKEGLVILTFIGGEPDHINKLRVIIQAEIDLFREKSGTSFKGFHANKVGEGNLAAYSAPFERIINAVISFAEKGLIHCGAIICSESKWDGSISSLKDVIKRELSDENSSIRKTMGTLSESQAPMFYQRFGQIYPAIAIKNSAFKDFETIECYPDSSGKWLSHGHQSFVAASSIGLGVKMNMFTSAEILANAFDNIIRKELRKTGPRFIKMEPKADESEPILQACDIISNLLLNWFRVSAGSIDATSCLKAELIKKNNAEDLPSLPI